ncbi:ABC transporter substrate-binding protein [Arthrobacter sp. A2-55]|uniref:ABC transporter substrate-binding protein n=1 Tax=Arthrobacter sp. A2-55 TaxID=2897337 RepID=UPI0021CDDB26|nr:ABC transporter substrate-binding protein [Arthrobacter sp. A2-55]MCU6480645.1 ABC transporter substrate-binding protein [Arthrobacter sp. A2-55]
MPKNKRSTSLSILAASAVLGAMALTGCGGGHTASVGKTSDAILRIPREDTATFTSNFNPFSPTALPMTDQAVFEPLLIVNPMTGKAVPWLGKSWTVDPDGKGVTFTLRSDVKWSDGQPMTAADVVSTFTLAKKIQGGYSYLSKVSAVNPTTVRFDFSKAYSPGLYEIGAQVIVPEHVWSKVSDPAKFTNANPVGTGPYTKVSHFQTQSYELDKNPNYWQPQKQQISGIEMLAFAGNSGANLAFENGDVDWSDQFIPSIQKSYVAKDPAHRKFWYPTTGGTIQWQLNTTKAPFNDVNVRKALSMAVDRNQVATLGESGYTHPADCTGLTDGYASWKDASIVNSCDWTKLNVAEANKMLDAAGYPRGANGIRTLKSGKPFAFSISVGSASSDWISVAQVIAKNMQAIGVQLTVSSPDWSQVVDGYSKGTFDTGIVWTNDATTPYEFYRGEMSQDSVVPVGTPANEDYHRFGDAQATTLLNQMAATSDPAAQKTIVNELQARFNATAPAIPLFPSPVWGAYSEQNFTGWPTAADPYATLSARSSTTTLVLTSLKPVK